MVAPILPMGLSIQMKGDTVSAPYIDMTAGLMQSFGARITKSKNRIHIYPGAYHPQPFAVEADWSSAAFWYESAALATEVDLELKGLIKESLQGDAILHRIYQNFGINTSFSKTGITLSNGKKKINGYFFDFTDFPDISPPVITTCAMLGLQGRFEGLKSLKIKETDRLLALKNEFAKLGIHADISDSDSPTLELKASRVKPVADLLFESYGDHRMAMTFAMLAIRVGPIRITNPDVVNKSYPAFWEHLQSTGFEIK